MIAVVFSFLFVSVLATTPTTPATTVAPVSTLGKSCLPLLLGLDCAACALAPSYAFCNSTTKRCQCQPGFSGNANTGSQCTCTSPSQVYIPGSLLSTDSSGTPVFGLSSFSPICVNVNDYVNLLADSQRQADHIQKALTFLGNTIYPKPTSILATLGVGTLDSILTPNVTSRISPVGNFNGFQGVVEYFYGFVAAPGFICTSVDVREIAAQGNVIGAKVNLFLNNALYMYTGGYPPQFFNLSLFVFFGFAADSGLIESIDVAVPNLGFLLDIPSTNAAYNLVHQSTINSSCALLTLSPGANPSSIKANGTCGGTVYAGSWLGKTENDRYNSCVTFYNNLTYGTHDRLNSNSFVCRNLHAQLTYFSPDVHCVHCGMTGGDSCIDFTYASFFQTDYGI